MDMRDTARWRDLAAATVTNRQASILWSTTPTSPFPAIRPALTRPSYPSGSITLAPAKRPCSRSSRSPPRRCPGRRERAGARRGRGARRPDSLSNRADRRRPRLPAALRSCRGGCAPMPSRCPKRFTLPEPVLQRCALSCSWRTMFGAGRTRRSRARRPSLATCTSQPPAQAGKHRSWHQSSSCGVLRRRCGLDTRQRRVPPSISPSSTLGAGCRQAVAFGAMGASPVRRVLLKLAAFEIAALLTPLPPPSPPARRRGRGHARSA